MTNIAKLLESPLIQTGRSGNFIQLVLAEAAGWGMPAHTIALLADLSSMLGYNEAMPEPAVKHLTGPLSIWRSSPDQPAYDQVDEVLSLAIKQKALIAFGGGKPGQLVGSAEVVVAIGNIIQGTCPPEYWDIFTWASIDTLSILTGNTTEQILAEKKTWKLIDDDEVLKPSGRLYNTYTEIVTTIRRAAIDNVRADYSRNYLRPLAARFVESHRVHREEALVDQNFELARRLTEAIDRIEGMFPGLRGIEQEMARYRALSVERRSG
jgi:hypothetical protein